MVIVGSLCVSTFIAISWLLGIGYLTVMLLFLLPNVIDLGGIISGSSKLNHSLSSFLKSLELEKVFRDSDWKKYF